MSKVYSGTKFNERDPSQDEIGRLFKYDESTGNLIWRERPREDFATDRGWKCFNTQFAGKVAGYVDNVNGYREIGINGRSYKSHRLIWIHCNGPIPEGMVIDHIDNDKLNNRINNLRLATHAENLRNSKKYVNNTTGRKGVTYHKAKGKYMARICIDGKLLHLGYGNLEECSTLYEQAANKYHGEFARIA